MSIKVIIEGKKKSKKKKLHPSMGAGAYVKDFYTSDAPQFKGKSKEERREMAIAAFLQAEKELKEEQLAEKRKKKRKKYSHPTYKKNKKYFGSYFYDYGLLHGDSSGGDAGGDGGGGDGNRSEKKSWDKKERKKRAKNCSNPKGFTMKQFCKNQKTRSKKSEKKNEGKDPKVGTGKKPKGSGRRLYTDENPKDTVSVKFSSVSAIRKTLAKSSFKSKSHKRQSQIINLIHQRARAAYKNAKDPKVKARLKKAFKYAEKRKEASKKKTIRLRKEKKK